jgi:hypothetical protein
MDKYEIYNRERLLIDFAEYYKHHTSMAEL